MISSLKSSLFRFFRTKLFLLVLGFSVVMGIAMVNNTCSDMGEYFFARPRYFDSLFVITSIRKLVFVIPFGSAIFCTMFTGSDISFRSINIDCCSREGAGEAGDMGSGLARRRHRSGRRGSSGRLVLGEEGRWAVPRTS